MQIVGLKILESDKQIADAILGEIKLKLDTSLRRARGNIEKQLRVLVAEKLRAAPEYDALTFGQLTAEFGLYEHQADSAVDGIVDRIANAVQVDVIPISYTSFAVTRGGYKIELFQGNYADIVTWADGIVDDIERNYSLPWLNWLLLQGGKILVRDYQVTFSFSNQQLYASRSRLGLMKKTPGKNWRVPSQFQGTVKNNWITRSLRGIDKEVEQIIKAELRKYI